MPGLLCTADAQVRTNTLRNLTGEQLDQCRSLKSFRRYVEADPRKWATLLVNDAALIMFLDTALVHLESVAARFNVYVSCLHAVSKDLPGTPFGRHVSFTDHISSSSTYV